MSNNKYFSKSRYPLDLTKKLPKDLGYEEGHQYGGNILPYNTFSEYDKMYPEGGKVKPSPKPQPKPVKKPEQNPPIYTTDPNDPRLLAYDDSLNIYNEGNQKYNKIKSTGKIRDTQIDVNSEKKYSFKEYQEEYNRPSSDFNIFNSGTNSNMQPIKVSQFRGKGVLGYLDYGRQAQYKKPVQPIVYRSNQTKIQQVNPVIQQAIPIKKESIVQLDKKGLSSIPTNSPISNIQLKPGKPIQERPKGNFLITTQDKPMRFERKKDYDEVLEILKAQGLTPKSKSELANGQEASANFAGTFETMMKWLEGKYEGTPSYEYGGNISGYNMNKYIADLGYPNNIPNSPYGQYNDWELSNYEGLMNNSASQAGNALGKEGVDSLSQAGESAGGAGGAMGGMTSYAGIVNAVGTGLNAGIYKAKGKEDPRNQDWQQTKSQIAQSNPFAALFHGIDEGLQGAGEALGGTKGQRAVQFFTDPIGFMVNRGALYKEGEEKRMKKVNQFNAKYNNENYDKLSGGNFLAKYGITTKDDTSSLEQEIFQDFDMFLQKKK